MPSLLNLSKSRLIFVQIKKFLSLLLFIFCIPSLASSSQQLHITLDGNSKGRTFDGIGAVSAGASSRLLIDYPEPQRSQILDYLFKPNYGAALQHLKVEIGADVNSTDGSEPSHMRSANDHSSTRGYEWWLMVEAHKRNPNIILGILPWGAPNWVKPSVSDKRDPYSREMAEYVVDFIKTAKRDYNLDIAYVGIWNERDPDIAYIKQLSALLKANHLSTQIACCDTDWKPADDILKDPELAAIVANIGAHYPRDEHNKVTTTDAARKTGKPLWSSEDQPNDGGGPIVSREWMVGGRILAHRYNANYIEGSMTATEIWSPVTSYYDNLAAPNSGLMYANTPWSGYYNVQGTIWATAHTTQFAQPGWQYLDASSANLPENGSYVAMRSPDKKNWSLILETIDAKQPQTISFTLTGGLPDKKIHIWQTNATRTFEHIATVSSVNDQFTYTFEPDSLYSLTTTTGQHKGTAQPPAQADFPLPYSDDFESTPAIGYTPKYLADQDGAFEVRPCAGRTGQCLEQVITEIPIRWDPLPDPYTLAGGSAWQDYSISAEIRFLSNSPALLMGRIDNADVFIDGNVHWPSAYVFRVKPNGAWDLLSTEYKKPEAYLASGNAKIDKSQWHHLELKFSGSAITASLDGNPLATVQSKTHTHGMFALGSEWDHVQFDNLRITP